MVDIFQKINIIYEEGDFLVLEKPAGILVHSTKYVKKNTLVDWLTKKYPKIENIGEKNRPGIVHRLDKDVSGLMVIAKSKPMYKSLVYQFKIKKVEKKYIALVLGQLKENSGIIKKPIGRTKNDDLVVSDLGSDLKFYKKAYTKYKVLKRFKNYTLLEIKLITGRTHQIRLHLKSIGFPILGDTKDTKNKLKRIFLHSKLLGFHDLSNTWQEFKSNLPMQLKNFLNKII